MVYLNISGSYIKVSMRHIGGSGGPRVVDAKLIKDWCTRFSSEFKILQEELNHLEGWLANKKHPWVSIWEIMAFHLASLYKTPGVHPVVIREIICRLLSKCILIATSIKNMDTFRNLNLCDIL